MSLVEKSTSKYLEIITESSFYFLELLNVCFGLSHTFYKKHSCFTTLDLTETKPKSVQTPNM